MRFFVDGEYYRRLLRYALPIALQSFATSLLNMVGGVMVGQLGDAPIAAIALAGQVFFLLQLILFGISSGSAIFTAQFWGRQDVPNIRRVLAISMLLSALPMLFFLALAQLLPEAVLGIYSTDAQVIELGAAYLRIFSWSFAPFLFTVCFAAVLRSTGHVMLPLAVSTGALGFNILLSYLLIFGKLGFPQLGVDGAAIANLVARTAECLAMLVFTYRYRLPAALGLADFLHLDKAFIVKVLKPVMPVAVNELLWSLGITTYNVAYARIGTEAIAGINIAFNIDALMFVPFIGIGHATAILVGNLIGAGEEAKAHRYAGRSLALAVILALFVGVLLYAVTPWVLSLYQASEMALFNARRVLTIISSLLWLRAFNMVVFIGVLRSGGDTRFAFVLDAIIIWVLGVPMAFLGAFVFNFPVYWVYLMVMSEEISKMLLALWRFFSKKWIHNLAEMV